MIKVDIRRVAKFAWEHKVAIGVVTILAMMNHANADEAKRRGEFITSKGLSQEYYCFKTMK